MKILKGSEITEPGHYWIRRNNQYEWTMFRVEVPERCHADCGIGAWDFVKIEPPAETVTAFAIVENGEVVSVRRFEPNANSLSIHQKAIQLFGAMPRDSK